MGHYVNFQVFPENTTRSTMLDWARKECACNCDRYENETGFYGNMFRIHDKIFMSQEEAERFLCDQGSYVDGAVKFRATENISTAKTQAIEEKISKLRKQKMDFLSKNPFAEQKVALVSCKKCGSKISRVELVKQNRSTCPVCMADMTSKTHQDRVKAYDKKIVALEKELADTRKKLANKAEIFWIAKVEVHV